jgi:CRP-like cAMP-binding protein
MTTRPAQLVVSAAMQDKLLSLATSISRAKGTVLFRHGDAVQGVFLIRNGKIQLALEGVDYAFPPRILGTGSVVGLPATVAGSPYSLTAQVVEDAELAFVARAPLLEALQHDAQLCFEVMDMLSGEISETRSALKRTSSPRARKDS